MWLLYAICAAITWGLSYSLDEKILHNKISPAILLFIQTFLALIVYFIVIVSTKIKSEFLLIGENKENYWLLTAAAFSAMVANVLICLSIKEKNATIAAIIELTYPIFTIVFTYLLFKQIHLNTWVIIGGLLIVAGAAMISIMSS